MPVVSLLAYWSLFCCMLFRCVLELFNVCGLVDLVYYGGD